MPNEIKYCGWCKNDKPEWLYVICKKPYGEELFSVRYHNCGAEGPLCFNEQEAIKVWNRRAGEE